jgi:hypothetical protein
VAESNQVDGLGWRRVWPATQTLSALYAHKGKHDLSFEMVRKLQANEPDFSYDKLRDKSYPAAGLHRTSIIDSLPGRQF